MKYAAHDDHSIYAIGDSSDEAVQNARDNAGDPDAEFDTTRIGDDLAARIERDGWNGNRQSFDIRNGEIVDTTSTMD